MSHFKVLLRRLLSMWFELRGQGGLLSQWGGVIGAIWVLLAVVGIGLLWHLKTLGETLTQTLVLQGADINASVMEEVRKYYSSNVIGPLRGIGIEVTSDYATKTHAIPLPATMAIEVGGRLRDKIQGVDVRLYGDHTFLGQSVGGRRDAFEREALMWLRDHPDKPYYRFETIGGVRQLRYAKADVASTGCLECHNSRPESPTHMWREGDVLGVLEIVRPISSSAMLIQHELQTLFGLFTGVCLLGLGGMGLAMHRVRRAAVILKDLVHMRTIELERAKEHAEQTAKAKAKVLSTVQAFFVGVDHHGMVVEWTPVAEQFFRIPLADVIGRSFISLPIQWDWDKVRRALERSHMGERQIVLDAFEVTIEGKQPRFLRLTITTLVEEQDRSITVMGEDVTDRLRMERDLASAQKLEAIGQLASGIAHEINTPIQFVGDNIDFLGTSFTEIRHMLDAQRQILMATKSEGCSKELITAYESVENSADINYLMMEIPKALEQSAEGINRVAKIVLAMKEFAHPGGEEKTSVDINKAITSTVTVARNEWRYVADITTDLDPALPQVPCLLGEFNQVILNMIVNAAHAIGEVLGDSGQKGLITITSRRAEEWIEIEISDTGGGMSEKIQQKIFDPFFTTKSLGKGTGQGLAIARSVIVDKHCGTITVKSQVGKGTSFIIRLPLTDLHSMSSVEKAA